MYTGRDTQAVAEAVEKVKDALYWEWVEARAKELESDGCTGVSQLFRICCFEHDCAYRTGKDKWGDDVTRAQADADFRACIQNRSRFGKFSPMALIRWAGVRLLARRAWNQSRSPHGTPENL